MLPRKILNPDLAKTQAELRKAAIVTGIVGAVFAVLFIVEPLVAPSAPRPKEPDQAFIDFYSSDERRKIMLVGLYVLPFAAVAFIWFMASLAPVGGPQLAPWKSDVRHRAASERHSVHNARHLPRRPHRLCRQRWSRWGTTRSMPIWRATFHSMETPCCWCSASEWRPCSS